MASCQNQHRDYTAPGCLSPSCSPYNPLQLAAPPRCNDCNAFLIRYRVFKYHSLPFFNCSVMLFGATSSLAGCNTSPHWLSRLSLLVAKPFLIGCNAFITPGSCVPYKYSAMSLLLTAQPFLFCCSVILTALDVISLLAPTTHFLIGYYVIIN
jgi:hypothetical protein